MVGIAVCDETEVEVTDLGADCIERKVEVKMKSVVAEEN